MIYGLRRGEIERMARRFDVICVGAGIGGLFAACFLQQAGRRVLLVEKHIKPGGCCSNFKRRRFVFDAGPHLFAGLRDMGTLDLLLRRLGIEVPAWRLDPMDVVHLGEQRHELPDGPERLRDHLKARFPREAAGLDRLFVDLRRYHRETIRRNRLDPRALETTFRAWIEGYVGDETLVALLTCPWPYLGSRPGRALALPMLSMATSYWFEGLFYPRGGSQALADALYHRFLGLGGTAVFGREATAIHRSGGRLVVELRDRHGAAGPEIEADRAVFNGSEFLLARLLGEPAARIEALRARYRPGIGALILYLGLSRPLPGVRGLYYDHARLDDPANEVFVIGNPTAHDPTLCAPGKGILTVYAVFPEAYHEVTDWPEAKRRAADAALARLADRFPELPGALEFVEAASPATLERYTANSDGSCYGHSYDAAGDGAAFVADGDLLGEDVLLAGHWTFPGAGVNAVAISGLRAAQRILGAADQ
jgi:phytoene dehydrogenase-like protein